MFIQVFIRPLVANGYQVFQIKRTIRNDMAKPLLQQQEGEHAGSFLWSSEKARQVQVNQIGVSACGATAVLNVLVRGFQLESLAPTH